MKIPGEQTFQCGTGEMGTLHWYSRRHGTALEPVPQSSMQRELTAYQMAKDNGLLRGVRILFAKQGLTGSEALTMLAIESCSSNPWWQIYP